MEFYLTLFFAHFFASAGQVQKNKIDKLFPKMNTFTFFWRKNWTWPRPFQKSVFTFFKIWEFCFVILFIFFLWKKKRRQRKFEYCGKIHLFQSKKGNYRKNCKNKKMAKKNSFVSSNWIFIRFFMHLRIRTTLLCGCGREEAHSKKKRKRAKKSSKKNSIRECFRPRLFSLWLDQIPINKL